MTVAGPLVFPGSRVLAGWQQQLAPLNPQQLWTGSLLLHRVEALVWASRSRTLDRLTQLVLQSLTLETHSTPASLDASLHLGPAVLRQLLQLLLREGLVQTNAGGEWQPTSLGRHALERGEYPAVNQERRRFAFVESGQPERPPHFLDLHEALGAPWPSSGDWRFDVGVLKRCIAQPVAWKQHHHFPLDVEGVLELPAGGPAAASENGERGQPSAPDADAPSLHFPTPLPESPLWQRVILDRPEQILVVLVSVAEGVVGYAVRQESWFLHVPKPAFRLGSDCWEVLPELEEQPPAEALRRAWRAWCQQRRLPATEAEACSLERRGHQLHVAGEAPILERLHKLAPEDRWLLAGEGRIRLALELV